MQPARSGPGCQAGRWGLLAVSCWSSQATLLGRPEQHPAIIPAKNRPRMLTAAPEQLSHCGGEGPLLLGAPAAPVAGGGAGKASSDSDPALLDGVSYQ